MSSTLQIDFLVVGAGPAGAALACFLGQNGLHGLVISKSPGTADTPRAHAVNPPTVECLRDIGIDENCARLAESGRKFQSTRWCRSIAGEEFGNLLSWGGDPSSASDIAIASPCTYFDLPQTLMEPLLIKYASDHNFDVRFKTELLDTKILENGTIACTIKDLITTNSFEVNAKYVFGADGGRSTVGSAFPFTFTRQPSQAVACNILFTADLGHLITGREAQLYWILQPDTKSRFGKVAVIRTLRPWNKWMLLAITPGTEDESVSNLTPQTPGLVEYLKDLVGDSTIDIEIERVDSWVVRETVADDYSWGRNVHLLGDAAHRHPPSHGMGSNTCVQDAYNLAWKAAYVSKGLAGPELLDSYTLERQPVGANLVKESNDIFRVHLEVLRSLGQLAATPEEGLRQLNELKESTAEGAARRELLHSGLEARGREGRNFGLAMNQFYVSKAIYVADEPNARPEPEGDPITDVHISTFPGSRLPHAWLGDTATSRKEVSTHDLAGKGSFCILTGHGGDAWRKAAEGIKKNTGIPINHYGIGLGLDYFDKYRQWQRIKEIDEDGCLLVRPDRVIAWRAPKAVTDCESKLLNVLSTILSRESSECQKVSSLFV